MAKVAAKEVAKGTAKEVEKEVAGKAVDVGKRLDTTKSISDTGSTKVDISKRVIPDGVPSNTEVGQELIAKQKQALLDRGMSPRLINDCTLKDGTIRLKTINERLVDSVQPDSGIKYIKKIVDLAGIKIEGVFPQFESVFTAQIPMDKLVASDAKQFKECISQLQNAIKDNPLLRDKFTPLQLEKINAGVTPGGYTWHHNEQVGKMELVNTEKHELAKHTGGRTVWGGGSNMR